MMPGNAGQVNANPSIIPLAHNRNNRPIKVRKVAGKIVPLCDREENAIAANIKPGTMINNGHSFVIL